MDYPDDSDGGALRCVAENGSDMTMPMYLDFHVAVPDQEAADTLASKARQLGYHAKVSDSAECKLPWTCECSTRMVVTYESVIAVQKELARLSAPLGGFPDGWGTFGNGPNGQPIVK
jgi:regulator of RNase E activity RraB